MDQETARGLSIVVEESETVIELLKREVEELKTTLVEAGKARPEDNPSLRAELEKVHERVYVKAFLRLYFQRLCCLHTGFNNCISNMHEHLSGRH